MPGKWLSETKFEIKNFKESPLSLIIEIIWGLLARVESYVGFLWFCFNSLCDWSRKMRPSCQPMRSKQKSKRDLVFRVFPRKAQLGARDCLYFIWAWGTFCWILLFCYFIGQVLLWFCQLLDSTFLKERLTDCWGSWINLFTELKLFL